MRPARVSVVAGGANNQLATKAEGAALQARGILYAPAYVLNGGGAMAFTSLYLGADVADDPRATDWLRQLFVPAD